MLSVKLGVPVNFGVIESKDAVCFLDLDVEIGIPSEELISESAILVFCAHVIDLVDHGADGRVFVHQDRSDEILIG